MMDSSQPIIFENIKIEADSDSAFFGLSSGESSHDSNSPTPTSGPGYQPFQEPTLSALLSSASPFSIGGSVSSSGGSNPGESSTNGSDQDLFSGDFDLPDFPCDFDLLDDPSTTSLLMDETSCSSSVSPSNLDTPPLTPPSPVVKLESETKPCLTSLPKPPPSVGGNLSSLAKILPALKSSRGRSASHDSPDVQALKRHIRMIRNRESASLSRKKKKEYVTSLEDRLKELECENAILKHENAQLKLRLEGGHAPSMAEKSLPHRPNARTKLIAKVALLGVCCFVMLSSPGGTRSQISLQEQSNHSSKVLQDYATNFPNQLRLHRSLQWHQDDAIDKKLPFEETRIPLNATKEEETGREARTNQIVRLTPRYISRRRVNFVNATIVPEEDIGFKGRGNCTGGGGFNKAESLRVQNHLKGLFSRGKPKRKQPVPKPFLYSLMDLSGGDNSKGLTVYDQRMQKYSNFLDNIQLREDTFYVVSLTMDDQLLLSAKASNASSRPKMSFLMPWKNDTLGGKEEVMQIDCEVTKVLNLKQFLKKAQP